MIVDAHQHFWNPSRLAQSWMTDEHAAIARTFEPRDLDPLRRSSGVAATVLVQSAADDRDTDYMFEVIEGVDWVEAVTAWVRLDHVDAAHERLDALRSAHPRLRGIRHLIHQEPDPHWILRPQVQEALELLQRADLLLELPAVFPQHLDDVPELSDRHPGLTIVIDHLAKPPLGTPEMPRWRAALLAAAERPNVFAKVSGLNTMLATGDWSASDLEPAVEAAVEAFGPGRLLFGSDWPVALLNGSYEDVVGRTVAAIRAVAGDGADAILGGNALRLYRIDRSRAG